MKLIFVYNADSGLFNALSDMAHKLLSPKTYSCQLCAITHGAFAERRQWRDFIDDLDTECEFLHRDEFEARHPLEKQEFPAIFREQNGKLALCASAAQIRAIDNIPALKALLNRRCIRAEKDE